MLSSWAFALLFHKLKRNSETAGSQAGKVDAYCLGRGLPTASDRLLHHTGVSFRHVLRDMVGMSAGNPTFRWSPVVPDSDLLAVFAAVWICLLCHLGPVMGGVAWPGEEVGLPFLVCSIKCYYYLKSFCSDFFLHFQGTGRICNT